MGGCLSWTVERNSDEERANQIENTEGRKHNLKEGQRKHNFQQ
jgi:hypothetical protein